MSPTMWNNNFSVGIDQIDAQRKVLIGHIAGLEASVDNPDEKQRWSSIHYAIVQLRDYTRIHFSVEECLMEILAYPDRAPHIEEHKSFVSVIEDLELRSITHNDITETEIIEFLRTWLVNHIATSDKKYSHYFSSGNTLANKIVA